MMRMNAFCYRPAKSQSDHLAFFDELASKFSLGLTENRTETRQLFTDADIVEVAQQLGVGGKSDDGQSFKHGLDDECVACLTRLVTYGKRVYQRVPSELEMVIVYCDDNNYPVAGIDLWTEGCSALPAGMVTVTGEEESMVTQLIEAIRQFKSKG